MAAFLERDDAGFVNDEQMMEQVFDPDIFQLVEYIRLKHVKLYNEDLNPNLIFTRLEEYQGHPNRAKIVMDVLFSHTPPPKTRTVNIDGDGDCNMAMNDDLPKLATPDSDREFNFSNSPVKVFLGERELGPAGTVPLIDLESESTSQASTAHLIDFELTKEGEIDSKEVQKILLTLLECFPDADVKYLRGIVSKIKNSLELNNEVERLLTTDNYPKQIKQVRSEPSLDSTGSKPDIRPSTSRGRRATTQEEAFSKQIKMNRLFGVIKNYRYLKEKEKRRETSNNLLATPQNDNARPQNECATGGPQNDYVTCLCCFEDQVLFEESEFCREGSHQFCRTCVRKLAEVAAAENIAELKCMAPDCTSTFSQEAAKGVLKPIVYEKWIQRCQLKEVKMADLPNFRTCPHCEFGAIIDNPNEKLFHCLNPECNKVTCLLCRGESHIPLRCDEVEKPKDVGLRTSEEEKMTDALIRSCPKCKLQYIKEDGCNMMRCGCGQHMCFVCRKPIDNYEHFRLRRCPIGNVTPLLEAIPLELYDARGLAKRARLTDDAENADTNNDEMSDDEDEQGKQMTKAIKQEKLDAN